MYEFVDTTRTTEEDIKSLKSNSDSLKKSYFALEGKLKDLEKDFLVMREAFLQMETKPFEQKEFSPFITYTPDDPDSWRVGSCHLDEVYNFTHRLAKLEVKLNSLLKPDLMATLSSLTSALKDVVSKTEFEAMKKEVMLEIDQITNKYSVVISNNRKKSELYFKATIIILLFVVGGLLWKTFFS